MNKSKLILSGLCLISVSFLSCKDDKDDPSPASGPGTVTIDISNVAGAVNVDETGGTFYMNSSNESFNVTRLKYYISKVQFYKVDALIYEMPESYFLVDESNQASTKLEIPNVPAGDYTSVRFTVGVDSAKTMSGVQTGALDPANLMYWNWSSGYIFFKIEGTSPASTQANNLYIYHIGGYHSTNNANREVEIDFAGDSLIVNGTREAEIHVLADVLKVFSTPNTISIAAINTQMTLGGNALLIADNYKQMFSFDHLHND
ncbi:MAG: MbnP family protein [Bacteroidia bacterium]